MHMHRDEKKKHLSIAILSVTATPPSAPPRRLLSGHRVELTVKLNPETRQRLYHTAHEKQVSRSSDKEGPRSETDTCFSFFFIFFAKLANTLTLQQTAVRKLQRFTYDCTNSAFRVMHTVLASHNSRTTCVSNLGQAVQDENIDNTAPSEPCDILF